MDEMAVLNLEGHQAPTNLKVQIYEIDLIGSTYFQDKANIVQSAHDSSGTSAIQQIWGRYLNSDSLQIISSSNEQLGKSDNKSQIQHIKPFAAIDKLRQDASDKDATVAAVVAQLQQKEIIVNEFQFAF